MPRIQIIDRVYTWKAFNNLLNYMAKPEHSTGKFIGATNLYIADYNNPEKYIKEQMLALFKFFNMEKNSWKKRRALHLILTVDDRERAFLTPQAWLSIIYELMAMDFPNCPSYFAVHDRQPEEEPKTHIHVMLVPIDIYTGASWSANKKGWYHICNDFRRICSKYIPNYLQSEPVVKFGWTYREKLK